MYFPHPEQDDCGALVEELDTGKKSYASNFDRQTPGWEELSKVACLCSNAEFKPEDLDKPVVERELVGDAILRCVWSLWEKVVTYRAPVGANKTLQELQMLSSVTLYCQVTMIVMT